MSYSFQPQPTGELMVIVFEGEISPEEERQAVIDFAGLPDLNPMADILVDRSNASMTVDVSDVRRHVHLVKSMIAGQERQPRMAIVAPGDVDFGMMRMLELVGGDGLPHKIMVVRNLNDACEWLEIDEDAIVWPPSEEEPT